MSDNTIVDSKQAVSVFLESLLKETELPEAVQVVEEPVVSLVVKEEVKIDVEIQPSIDIPLVETIVETKTVEEVSPDVTSKPEIQSEAVNTEIDIPDLPFQALMFKVAGLTLAVRLVELSGVLEWDETQMTEMPGHSPFYMGLRQYLGKSIPIVDTARLVFPADKLVALAADNPIERVKRIVLIDDGKWGLACDEIAEVVDLNGDDVKWRPNRSKRKWMAGTVIQHMCALVDASGFSEMLEDGSHERK